MSEICTYFVRKVNNFLRHWQKAALILCDKMRIIVAYSAAMSSIIAHIMRYYASEIDSLAPTRAHKSINLP